MTTYTLKYQVHPGKEVKLLRLQCSKFQQSSFGQYTVRQQYIYNLLWAEHLIPAFEATLMRIICEFLCYLKQILLYKVLKVTIHLFCRYYSMYTNAVPTFYNGRQVFFCNALYLFGIALYQIQFHATNVEIKVNYLFETRHPETCLQGAGLREKEVNQCSFRRRHRPIFLNYNRATSDVRRSQQSEP